MELIWIVSIILFIIFTEIVYWKGMRGETNAFIGDKVVSCIISAIIVGIIMIAPYYTSKDLVNGIYYEWTGVFTAWLICGSIVALFLINYKIHKYLESKGK